MIQNNNPKLKLKLKEENTNLKSDINVKQIGKEDIEHKKAEIDSIEKDENIDSIINVGEIFLSFFKKNKFFGLDSNVQNSLEEGIKHINKKYIQIEKNKYNEIENEINEIKLLNKNYKEKIGLLLAYIISSENEEVYEKIKNYFLLIFNDNKNFKDILNALLIDKKSDNKTIFKNIEDYEKGNLNVNATNNNVINDENINKNLNDNLNNDRISQEIKLNFSESDNISGLGDCFSFNNII